MCARYQLSSVMSWKSEKIARDKEPNRYKATKRLFHKAIVCTAVVNSYNLGVDVGVAPHGDYREHVYYQQGEQEYIHLRHISQTLSTTVKLTYHGGYTLQKCLEYNLQIF